MSRIARPTERFSGRMESYKKFRPDYPDELVPFLTQKFPQPPPLQVADVGSGTGIFTRRLLDGGHEVFAVEPNSDMRSVAEKDLGSRPLFHSVAATAEETGLPTASLDLINVAQAFHWFDPVQTGAEFRRLLKPTGFTALIWNNRETESAFGRAYEKFLLDCSTDYRQVRAQHEAVNARIPAFFETPSFHHDTFSNEQRLTEDALQGRFFSTSYCPPPGTPQLHAALEKLSDLFHRHQQDGIVSMIYITDVYTGRPRA